MTGARGGGVEKRRLLASTDVILTGSDCRSPASPFPEGWYFVASRDEIRKRGLIEKVWLGQEIVAWCDDAGTICVADAFCPHMGSHLGPTVGGQVRDGCLVCPFHGFAYDASGQCVSTPTAPAPKAARLAVMETHETAGMVFAWWSPVGRASHWNLPDLDHDGWSGLSFRTFRMKSHPEYTTENAVDMNHLAHVHNYFDTAQVEPVSVEGAHLKNAFDFKRMRRIAGFQIVADISLVVHLHGLGYSLVDYRERSIGLEGRCWILVTPIDGTWMEMVLVAQIRDLIRPKRAIAGLRFLPAALRTKILVKALVDQQAKDVEQDIPIWERKRYQPQPALNRTDGQIMLFRRFCRQFYPERPEAFATDRPRREVAS